MNTILRYKCQFCKEEFDDEHDCFEHELEHIGISQGTFHFWKHLTLKVRLASCAMSDTHNEKTIFTFDKAVDKLTKFKEEHNLTGLSLGNIYSQRPEFIINGLGPNK